MRVFAVGVVGFCYLSDFVMYCCNNAVLVDIGMDI